MRGWDVFDSNRGLTIQRDDELDHFPDDEYAVLAAINEAASGDDYAKEAIICVVFQDYARWESFLRAQNGPAEYYGEPPITVAERLETGEVRPR